MREFTRLNTAAGVAVFWYAGNERVRWESWVLLGELSAVHGFLQTDCAACHTAVQGVDEAKCTACYADNQALLERQDPLGRENKQSVSTQDRQHEKIAAPAFTFEGREKCRAAAQPDRVYKSA